MALRKIDLMHKMFGSIPNKSCKECSHLCSYKGNRKYYKCEVYGITNSEASDWRLHYDACGMFDVGYEGLPVIKTVGRKEPVIAEIIGQLKMEGIK